MLLLALAVGLACSSDPAQRANERERCTLSSDCRSGLTCALGSCRQPCLEARDCGNGGACITDGVSAACQSLAEREEGCDKQQDCPMPLACAGDYRCRNLCEEDVDCNVLGISGRVCAEDAAGRRFCAEPEEVDGGTIVVMPPVSKGLPEPVDSKSDDAGTADSHIGNEDGEAPEEDAAGGGADAAGGGADAAGGGMDAAGGGADATAGDAGAGDSGANDGGVRPPSDFAGKSGAVSTAGCNADAGPGCTCVKRVEGHMLLRSDDTVWSYTPFATGDTLPAAWTSETNAQRLEVRDFSSDNHRWGWTDSPAPYACVVTTAGTVVCTQPTPELRTTRGPLSGLIQVTTSSSANGNGGCARDANHSVWCWWAVGGADAVATPVVGAEDGRLFTGAHLLATGSFGHICALMLDSTVMCWGDNAQGQLGNGMRVNSTYPVAAVGIPNAVVQLALGAYRSYALDDTGHVYAWGSNTNGALGVGTTSGVAVRPTLVRLSSGEPLDDVIDVAVEIDGACALRATDRSIWCWGPRNQPNDGVAMPLLQPGIGPVAGIVAMASGMRRVGWIGRDGVYYRQGVAVSPPIPCPAR